MGNISTPANLSVNTDARMQAAPRCELRLTWFVKPHHVADFDPDSQVSSYWRLRISSQSRC